MFFSNYNEFINPMQTDGYEYLFNCQNKKWMKLDTRLAAIIRSELKDIERLKSIHPELFDVMVAEKFIVPTHQNEIAEVLIAMDRKLSSKEAVTITINPTLDCNLRCWYCYEEHVGGSMMDEGTIKGVINYLKKLTEDAEVKYLHLAFFGGEPLLGFGRVVKPIIAEVSRLCMENDVNFDLHFTTNAVCLTPKVLEWLMPWSGRTTFQIAFDGGENYHDSTKHFGNGLGSYEIVLNHTKNAIRHGFNVVLRCNYNKETLKSFLCLTDDLKEFHQARNLRFSFHKIWQAAEDSELLEEKIEFIKSAEKLNINSNLNQYITNALSPCYGDYRYNLVINYNGDIFKCTARQFKRENRLGYIDHSGVVHYEERAIQRAGCHYTPHCYGCRMLPICPLCFQSRAEANHGECPMKIDEDGIKRNYHAFFQELSGITLEKVM